MRQILIAGIALAIAAPAAAQNVYGNGGGPCTDWTANAGRKWQNLNNVNWLMGYLSGVNRNRGPGARLLGDVNVQAATGFVAQFCAANPNRMIFEGADALIADLDGARPR